MQLHWLAPALADIENILSAAAARDIHEARTIAERITNTEQGILLFPKAAHYVQELDYYERYVPRTRIILVYRLTEDAVIIIAAFHTYQSTEKKPK